MLKEGQEIEALLVGVDRKKRSLTLSIRAKESHEEQAAMQEYAQEKDAVTTRLGDLLKKKLDAK